MAGKGRLGYCKSVMRKGNPIFLPILVFPDSPAFQPQSNSPGTYPNRQRTYISSIFALITLSFCQGFLCHQLPSEEPERSPPAVKEGERRAA